MHLSTFVLLFTLVVSGCAGGAIFTRLDETLSSGDCAAALALVEEGGETYGSRGQLLYLLDAAMVTLQCGDLDAAQAYFRRAEDLAERLWTESISRQAISLVTNDAVLDYAGEDFERVMIHLMSAIGYLQADQLEEALVEARRLDSLLTLYNDAYEKKNVYQEDAFARYLSGILHEADGQWDEAFIDYRRAAEVYREDYRAYDTDLPDILVADLVHAASAADRLADIQHLMIDLPAVSEALTVDRSGLGKVVVITFAGHAPQKVQDMVVVPSPQGPIGVAFPRMLVTPPRCGDGWVTLLDEDRFFEAELTLVEDINRIAVKNLDDRRGRIMAKTIARAVAKQIAIHGIAQSAKDEDRQAIETILNLANLLLVERADTRSWRTLPGRIYLTRLIVPPGAYRVELEACGRRFDDLGSVAVTPGTTRFLFRDLRYPLPESRDIAP